MEGFLNAWLVARDREIRGTYTLTFLNAKGSRRTITVMLVEESVRNLPVGVAFDKIAGDRLLQSRSKQSLKMNAGRVHNNL